MATLPALLIIGWLQWRRRPIAGVLIGLATVVLMLEGWVAPMSSRAWYARHGNVAQFAASPTVHATTGRLLVLAADERPRVAQDAQLTLQAQGTLISTLVAFGGLGLVVGRARRRHGAPLTLRALTIWWAGGWLALSLLTFWSASMGLRGAIPRWLPVLALLAIGAVAQMVLARQLHPRNV